MTGTPVLFEQVKGPVHDWDLRESHGTDVVIIMFRVREVVRFHTPADPVVCLEDIIRQIRDGKVVQNHCDVQSSCTGSDDTYFGAFIEVDFWQVKILGKLQWGGRQRCLPRHSTM